MKKVPCPNNASHRSAPHRQQMWKVFSEKRWILGLFYVAVRCGFWDDKESNTKLNNRGCRRNVSASKRSVWNCYRLRSCGRSRSRNYYGLSSCGGSGWENIHVPGFSLSHFVRFRFGRRFSEWVYCRITTGGWDGFDTCGKVFLFVKSHFDGGVEHERWILRYVPEKRDRSTEAPLRIYWLQFLEYVGYTQ